MKQQSRKSFKIPYIQSGGARKFPHSQAAPAEGWGKKESAMEGGGRGGVGWGGGVPRHTPTVKIVRFARTRSAYYI